MEDHLDPTESQPLPNNDSQSDNSTDVQELIPQQEIEASTVEEDNNEETSDESARTRFMGGMVITCIVAAGALLFFTNSSDSDTYTPTPSVKSIASKEQAAAPKTDPTRCPGIRPSKMVMSRMKILDTIYTTDSMYLEINLKRQVVSVHYKSGREVTFLISSGNPSISKGMRTPTGFFTVQSKTPLAISHQFNDAKLINWVGVQGGVGFHALAGTGYYWNLGKRPSSHGCIRMSHDEVKKLYDLVHIGAPIISHDGNPSRVIAFCSPGDTSGATLIDSANVYNRNLGKERYNSLMSGEYWVNPQPRIVHLRGQRVRWGMPCGDASRIPAQKLPEETTYADALKTRSALTFPDRSYTTVNNEKLFAMFNVMDSIRQIEHRQADSAMDKPDINE